MKKALAGVAVMLMCNMGFAAQGEDDISGWICDFQGKWRVAGEVESGDFEWLTLWKDTSPTERAVRGDLTDDYGNSTLNGSCKAGQCEFVQVYSTGELENQRFYWRGAYTEKPGAPERKQVSLRGSWGETPQSEEGVWHARAECGFLK